MTVAVISASPAHVGRIANRMRAVDRLECEAMGHGPKQALRQGIMNSSICFTALVDGRPEAMFGLVINNALCGKGTPWFLGSDAVYRHPREMLTWGPIFVRAFCDSTPHLSNLVSCENDRAIRFLRRLGFALDREGVIVIAGAEFIPFAMDRS